MFDIIYRFDPTHGAVDPLPATADAAQRRLEDGNREFAAILGGAHAVPSGSRILYFDLDDIGIGTAGKAPRQRPFAAVLGCADARVPVELIFNQACNEIFVVRVAGNVLGQEGLGSFDYAVQHLRSALRLLVILGHSQCGAVSAAADAYLRPVDYMEIASSHPLRSVVNSLFPAVCGAAAALARACGAEVTRQPGYRAALIETAVTFNAALTATALRQELIDGTDNDLRVVFGVYDLATRRVGVHLAERDDDVDAPLRQPPRSQEEAKALGSQVANSAHIQHLLRGAKP